MTTVNDTPEIGEDRSTASEAPHVGTLSLLEEIDFDWVSKWWILEPAHAEYLWGHRYERAELEAARAALKDVYSPGFCRDYLRQLVKEKEEKVGVSDTEVRTSRMRRGLGRLLLGLFQTWMFPPGVLALGIDVARVMPEKPSPKWLERLREPLGVIGTAFEAEVWANCLRAGFKAEHVRERKDTKTPDLLLVGRDRQIALELKDLSAGEDEMVRFEHQPFLYMGRHRAPDDRTFRVELAKEFRDLAYRDRDREEYRRRFDEVMESVDNELGRLDSLGWPLGEHVVPGLGSIEVFPVDADNPPGSISIDYAGDDRPEHQARRILDPLRIGAAKFRAWKHRPECASVIIVDFPHYDVDKVHVAVKNEVRSNPTAYSETDGIILRRKAMKMADDPRQVHEYFACFSIRLPRARISVEELVNLARHALDSPHGLTAPIRLRDQPDLMATAERLMLWGTEVDADE